MAVAVFAVRVVRAKAIASRATELTAFLVFDVFVLLDGAVAAETVAR